MDDEVYEFLKSQAEPFVDTPNSVLRRLLGLAPTDDPDTDSAVAARGTGGTQARSGGPSVQLRRSRSGYGRRPVRAPSGSLLPSREYTRPVLQALVDAGGSAPAAVIVEVVGKHLGDRLTELDRGPLQSGEVRWKNRTQFARLRLVQRGLLAKDSPPGTWEITEEGREYLKELAGRERVSKREREQSNVSGGHPGKSNVLSDRRDPKRRKA